MWRGAFQATFILASALAWFAADRVLARRLDHQRQDGKSATIWWHSLVSAALAACLIAQPLLWPSWGFYSPHPLALALQLFGVAVVTASLALVVWARLHLGRYYTQYAELQVGHVVIDTGPYAYVRHPIFSGYFGYAIGLLCIVPAWPMVLATIYALVMFTSTALRDERFLRAHLPGYTEYMQHTSRFVPWPRTVTSHELVVMENTFEVDRD